MLQKLGKIKGGHFFLREYMQVNWSTSSPHFLVEHVMAVRMILSLLKLVPNSVKYSTNATLGKKLSMQIQLVHRLPETGDLKIISMVVSSDSGVD